MKKIACNKGKKKEIKADIEKGFKIIFFFY